MADRNFLQSVIGEIANVYEWVAEKLSDDATRAEILIDLALPPDHPVGQPFPRHTLEGINLYRQSIRVEDEVSASFARDFAKLLGIPGERTAKLVLPRRNLENLRKFENANDPGFDEFKAALGDLKELFNAVKSFVRALGVLDEANIELSVAGVTQRLLEILTIDYLRVNYPMVYWIAQPFAFIEEPLTAQTGARVFPGRILKFLFFDGPRRYFHDMGFRLRDEADAKRWSDALFLPFVIAASYGPYVNFLGKTDERISDEGDIKSFEILANFGWDFAPGSITPIADLVADRTLSMRVRRRVRNPETNVETDIKADLSAFLVPRDHGGPAMYLNFGIGSEFSFPLSKRWKMKVKLGLGSAADLFFAFDDFEALFSSDLSGPNESSEPLVSVGVEAAEPDKEPLYRLGKEDGARLEFGKFGIEGVMSPKEVGLRALTRESQIVLTLGKSPNGFLAKILPGEKKIPLNFGLGWSLARGFFIEDGQGNAIKQTKPQPQPFLRNVTPLAQMRDGARPAPMRDAAPPPPQGGAGLQRQTPINQSFAGVRVQTLSLDLKTSGGEGKEKFTLATTVTLDAKLGPVSLTLDKVGFALTLDLGKQERNLGFADLDFGFQTPEGIGVSVDASVVHGGGFLRLDPANGQYAGVIHLEIEGGIAIKALGLLATRLPDGSKGFSLLVIITAEGFRPIPIGFGFMLAGIGGLLGINRTVNQTALQEGARNGALDAILFPRDPVRNAPQYLAALGAVFPPANDQYLFAPMARITWGTPALVTINVALVFEFGARLRFFLLGQLFAILPNRDNDLVKLQMNVVGGMDFDQKTAFLDAILFDSRIARKFVITGEMRMRMRWGNQPMFALSVGGMHPAFPPPPGLEGMQRCAIILADSDDLKIRCEAYFAITSNSVQFGAHAFLFARAAGFTVEGHIGFDVLIQFDPFKFIAEFQASIQLKRGSRNLFKVKLEGSLSGPRPLHVRGKASFEIFWVDISFSFSKTLLSGQPPPLPAPVDVMPQLKQALSEPGNWAAALPTGDRKLVTLREGAAPGEVRLHPLGTLEVRQSVVPLNIRIARFGNARPVGGPRVFQLQHVRIGTQAPITNPELTREHFAPAQFQDLTDDQKLSSPSFEQLVAGARFGSDRVITGGSLAMAADYEEIFITDEEDGVKNPAPHRADNALLIRFAQWSAVALSDARRIGGAHYHGAEFAAPQIQKGFTVASVQDLTPQSTTPAGPRVFETRTEAREELQRIEKAKPGLPGELQIVTVRK
ncbi:MAG: DUF6603 domain-containing protein [Blastocatellia bacterium]